LCFGFEESEQLGMNPFEGSVSTLLCEKPLIIEAIAGGFE